jgi:thiamine biosynthesis lipoprotein
MDDIEIKETPFKRDDGGVSMDVFAMDTYMNLLAYGDRAEEAVTAAAQEIHKIDDMLSTGNPDSEISRLNAAGQGEVSETVVMLVEQSQSLYKQTEGLFDIAIYPVMKCWGFPTQDYKVPAKEELDAALKLADVSRITIGSIPASPAAESAETSAAPASTSAAAVENPDASAETSAPAAEAAAEGDTAAEQAAPATEAAAEGNTAADQAAAAAEAGAETGAADPASAQITLGMPGMEIDLGGIAKGYTSSRVMEVFKEYGIEHGIVSLGGNVQALGTKKNGKAWRVAIQNPESELDYLGVLEIEDKCVITSGGYERFFEQDGVRYHHIIDPRTGYPADSGIISATIISKDGTLADGLSTSLFIMGLEKAEKYWRANSDQFDFILEDKSGKLYVSEGVAESLTTEAEMEVVKK